jgi:hypothetical protein
MGFIRLAVFGLLFLSIVYILVAIYSRSVRQEKLEDEWDEEIKEGDRDAFIDEGLKHYEGSLRKKLILLVFVVPICAVAVLFFVVN